jgi:hypothetical protein
MKRDIFLLSFILVALFSGCEPVEDEEGSGSPEYSYDDNQQVSANQCTVYQQNSAGCFGNEPMFRYNRVDIGFWALYKKSDNNKQYYDRYFKSYEFLSDGSVKQRTQGGVAFSADGSLWGASDDGNTIRLDTGESLKYADKRYGDGDCYDITYSGVDYKLCAEPSQDTTLKHASGYYGDSVRFGNYSRGDLECVGQWSVGDKNVTLSADGNTSNNGEWGVSEDGKVITIDSTSYIVNKYPDNGCIDTYTVINYAKSENVRLCKL